MASFATSNDERALMDLQDGKKTNYIPSGKLFLKYNPLTTQEYQVHTAEKYSKEDYLTISLKSNYITLDHLMLLDILATNNWKRPIYFTSVQEPYQLGLDKYLQLEGFAYKLTPFKSEPKDIAGAGIIDGEQLYHKYMEQFSFSSIANPKVYMDYTHIYYSIGTISLRTKFALLAGELLDEGKPGKAVNVLDKITQMLPNSRLPYDYQMVKIAELYIKAGESRKGENILKELASVTKDNLNYYQSLSSKDLAGINFDVQAGLYTLEETRKLAETIHNETLVRDVVSYWDNLEKQLFPKLR